MLNDVDVLEKYVRNEIGTSPDTWPGGWPGQVDAALLDAVFSVRARYGSRARGTGVYGAVTRWQKERKVCNDLTYLATYDPSALRKITNDGKISGRYKAEVVIEAAGALSAIGAVRSNDFEHRMAEARSAYLSVKGCGPVTWAYLRMLLGLEDVKADVWVRHFVARAIGSELSAAEVSQLVKSVAARMNVSATDLDHAIWRHQRSLKSLV
jgi:hypothetical protein